MRRIYQLGIMLLAVQSGSAHEESAATSSPYVLKEAEAELLIDRQGRTNTILVSPKTGSNALAMGSQLLPPGARILLHKHERTEEILYITEGSGLVHLDGEDVQVEGHTVIYVPAGTWHGVESESTDLHVLWVVTPPGLDEFLRGLSWPPGETPKQLSSEQIRELERKHDSVTKQEE